MSPLRFHASLSLLVVAAAAGAQDTASTHELVKYWVAPEHADTSIHRFTARNYIVFEKETKSSAPLLVFMPGTNGQPMNSTTFSDVAAHQGYRVIGLEYNDSPAVMQVCPRSPDTKCAEKFRQKRIYGGGRFDLIDQEPQESIVNRLMSLLATLSREHPDEGWGDYMHDGQPDWERIAVSGLSQGAGMAAYIAQKTRVARVILFSSPWDSYGPRRTLAPWISAGAGATPRDRWFASYHEKEPTADLIARAYSALKIPAGQIRVFRLEPNGKAEYHPSGVANGATPRRPDGSPAYLDDWKFLVGQPH
jgi:hypothetical protein